mgnify:FL=1
MFRCVNLTTGKFGEQPAHCLSGAVVAAQLPRRLPQLNAPNRCSNCVCFTLDRRALPSGELSYLTGFTGFFYNENIFAFFPCPRRSRAAGVRGLGHCPSARQRAEILDSWKTANLKICGPAQVFRISVFQDFRLAPSPQGTRPGRRMGVVIPARRLPRCGPARPPVGPDPRPGGLPSPPPSVPPCPPRPPFWWPQRLLSGQVLDAYNRLGRDVWEVR